MPELPDVEGFKKYLDATALHKTIKSIEVENDFVLKGMDVEKFKKVLTGDRFSSSKRHGKFLFIDLMKNGYLVLHFGMTGSLNYYKNPEEQKEHERVIFEFENGYRLGYDNQRMLGQVRVVEDLDQFIKKQNLGPDVLDDSFDYQRFREVMNGRRGLLKTALMNQSILSGIGNEYSDEILFQLQLHPKTRIDDLNDEHYKVLFRTIKDTLAKAIERQHSPTGLPDHFLLSHRNKGEKCPRCGHQIETVSVSGRTAYYCPACQAEHHIKVQNVGSSS